MRPSILLFALLLIAGCTGPGSTPPAGTLDPGSFARVYAGLLVAGIPPDGGGSDSTARSKAIDSLLASHHVTRARFDSSVAWYNADVHRWREVMDSTTRILEAGVTGAY